MRRLFIVLLSILLLTGVGGIYAVVYISNEVNRPLNIAEDTLFTIDKGSNAYRTVNVMRKEGYLTSAPIITKIWLKFIVEDSAVKSGTYMLKPGFSLVDVFRYFVKGDEHLFAVSLVEGLTLAQWIATLSEQPEIIFDIDDASLAQTVANPDISWCCEHAKNNEGLYLADTYFYTRGTKASDILARSHISLIALVSSLWEGRALDLPLTNPYEALILASIIEKETAVPSERSLIAGVFVNRLHKNMRLQTDPTVIYGIGPEFDGNITRKHLRTPTPYNTYVIKGLPPTPIAMAGKEAIKAALRPKTTDALYFVAKGDGGHQFSTTLEAHNAAVRKYQLKR